MISANLISLRKVFSEYLSSSKVWTLLILLFLTSRMLLILFDYHSIYSIEDQEQGYIAIEILSGLRAPLINYQVDSYTGGTLLMGIFAVPFIYFLGISMFSLKILALVLSLLTFTIVLFFTNSFFGRKTAFYAGLLWIFAPPLLTSGSLMVLGSHERLFPAMGLVCIFSFYCKAEKRGGFLLFGTGVLAGWAMTWSYINLIVILSCLITLFRVRGLKPFSKKETFLILAGFLTGSFQWIFYNYSHSFAGIRFLTDSTVFREGVIDSIIDFLKRPIRFHTKDIPYSLSFEPLPGIPSLLQCYAYFLILAAVILADVFRSRHSKEHRPGNFAPLYFFRTYLLLYPIFYSFTSYSYDVHLVDPDPWTYRYLIPYFAFALLYGAILITRLRFRKWVVGFLIVLGLLSQVTNVWGQPFGEVFQDLAFKSGLRGYVWQHGVPEHFQTLSELETHLPKTFQMTEKQQKIYFCSIANSLDFWNKGTPQELTRFILKIPREPFRRYFFRRCGLYLELNTYNPEGLEKFSQMLQSVPERYQADLILGGVRGFGTWISTDWDRAQKVLQDFKFSKPELFYLSFGNNLFRAFRNGHLTKSGWEEMLAHIHAADPAIRVWIYRGMGSAIFRSFRFEKILRKNFSRLGHSIPREDLYWGVGFYLGRRHYSRMEKGLQKITLLDPRYQPSARQGLQYFHSLGNPSAQP